MKTFFNTSVRYPFLLLLCAGAALGGCALLPAEAPSTPASYRSDISDAQAKAYFLYTLAQLEMTEARWPQARAALLQAIALDPESTELLLALAEVQLQLQQEDGARDSLERALALDPGLVPAHQRLGQIWLRRGQIELALQHLKAAYDPAAEDEKSLLQYGMALVRAERGAEAEKLLLDYLRRHPEAMAVRYSLARLYRQLGRTAQAESYYRQAIEHNPALQPAILELATLLAEQERLADALDLLAAALRRDPEQNAYRHQATQLLLKVRRFDEARGHLEDILRRDPDDVEARRKLGLVQMEQRNWAEAEATLRPLAEGEEADDGARYYLGLALEQQDKDEAALAVFSLIPADAQLYPDAVAHRSVLLRRLGRPQEAAALLNGLLDQGVERMEFFLYLAGLLRELQQPDTALEVLQRGRQRFPTNTRFPYQAGLLLDEKGDKAAAEAQMQQVLELDPQHADALNYLAYLWAEQGVNLERALEYIQRALQRKKAAYMVDTLGWVYFKLGRFNEAVAQLEQASREMPEDLIVLEHLADAWAAQGQREKALRAYETILRKQPDNAGVKLKRTQLRGTP